MIWGPPILFGNTQMLVFVGGSVNGRNRAITTWDAYIKLYKSYQPQLVSRIPDFWTSNHQLRILNIQDLYLLVLRVPVQHYAPMLWRHHWMWYEHRSWWKVPRDFGFMSWLLLGCLLGPIKNPWVHSSWLTGKSLCLDRKYIDFSWWIVQPVMLVVWGVIAKVLRFFFWGVTGVTGVSGYFFWVGVCFICFYFFSSSKRLLFGR